MMMRPDEITVTWWCCQCNKYGKLIFHNQNTVGERLDMARAEHKELSPNCELDWHQVFVRTEIKDD
jgi:hypothetical protein